MSKASAPGKVILFGEHFVVYGVKAILAAIDRRITVTSQTVGDSVIEIRSDLGASKFGLEEGTDVAELRPFEFLAKKMIKEFAHRGGIKMEIESEIPHGVGLGSSSAACVAAAASVSGLFEKYSKSQICELAIEAEKTIFESTSGADCTVCTHGGIITYGKGSGFERTEFEPNFSLIISNSAVTHSTDKIVAKVAEFRDGNVETFDQLCRKESELIEGAKAEIKSGNPQALGALMGQNQEYLRQIGVSNESLEQIIRVSGSGSHGSKITGAGGGGCIISIADEGSVGSVLGSLERNGTECFAAKIDYSGLETF